MKQFNLEGDDFFAVDLAIKIVRRFLKEPKISSRQVIGLGNALYALERLPDVTEGACCMFGIVYRAGNIEFEEMRYITFSISDYMFQISKGGSVYDQAVGGDSFSEPDWLIEIDGYKDTNMYLFDIEDSVEEYLNLGAKIEVNDESDFDF